MPTTGYSIWSIKIHVLTDLQSVRTVYEIISEIQESKRANPKRY